MKQIVIRLRNQLKNYLDTDLATSDRPLSFQVITFILLLGIAGFLVFGILKLLL